MCREGQLSIFRAESPMKGTLHFVTCNLGNRYLANFVEDEEDAWMLRGVKLLCNLIFI